MAWARDEAHQVESSLPQPRGPPWDSVVFLVETLELRGWGADPRATQRSPSEKMARPGLLSWPLVRGAERSLGGGGDPWGQIRPVLWSPRALPTAEQGEPTAHKQGAEPGHRALQPPPSTGRQLVTGQL